MQPILSIAIPTYNRHDCLQLLLAEIRTQLADISKEDIELLISNNCSTDQTPDVIAEHLMALPGTVVVNNETNMGADYNISQCFEKASGTYVWIIGDDDLPIAGGISKLIQLLKSETPDLLFLKSIGIDGDLSKISRTAVGGQLEVKKYSRNGFAREVNIYLTYISAIVLKKSTYYSGRGPDRLRKYSGTAFVQLEWTLGALLYGEKFALISTPIFYGRVNNSGGYKLFEIFAKNYIAIANDACANFPYIRSVLVHYALIGYFPGLIYRHRFLTVGHFSDEPFFGTLSEGTRRYAEFWLLLAPISLAPKYLAYVFLFSSKLIYKALKLLNRII